MIFATKKNISRVVSFLASSSVAYDNADAVQKEKFLDTLNPYSLLLLGEFVEERKKMTLQLTRNSEESRKMDKECLLTPDGSGYWLFRESDFHYWRICIVDQKYDIVSGEWIRGRLPVGSLCRQWRRPAQYEIDAGCRDRIGRTSYNLGI